MYTSDIVVSAYAKGNSEKFKMTVLDGATTLIGATATSLLLSALI